MESPLFLLKNAFSAKPASLFAEEMLGAGGREGDLQAVEFGVPEDLAGQAGIGPGHHRVELVLLVVGGGIEPAQPFLGDEDVAGGAFAGPAAQAFDGQAPVPNDL